MSRKELGTTERLAFVSRFVEMCGTAEPARIQRMLNISYQAAKNYLEGRLPSSDLLITMAERTGYSIHWLLTGRGKKFVDDLREIDTPLPAGQMEAFVRKICVEVINEFSGRQEIAQPKVVVLQSSELMSETAVDETIASSDRNS